MQTAVVRRSSFVKRISPASTCGWEESVMVDSGSPVNTTRELGGSPDCSRTAIHGFGDRQQNQCNSRESCVRKQVWGPAWIRTRILAAWSAPLSGFRNYRPVQGGHDESYRLKYHQATEKRTSRSRSVAGVLKGGELACATVQHPAPAQRHACKTSAPRV